MKITKKTSKQELVLDGVIINSLEELREHPSTELLELHESGTLGQWLRHNGGEEEAQSLETYTLCGDIAVDLAFICQSLAMDVDIEDIKECLVTAGKNANEVAGRNQEQHLAHARTIMGQLTQKLGSIAEEAEGGYVTSKTVTYSEDSDSDTVFHLKNYKAIADVAINDDPSIFSDHALALIDKGIEFNSPSVSTPFVVRNVDSFLTQRVFSSFFLVKAKNVFIDTLTFSRWDTAARFVILAENVFLGKDFGFLEEDTGCCGVIACRRFVMPYEGEREHVSFSASDKDLSLMIRKQDQATLAEKLASSESPTFRAASGIFDIVKGANTIVGGMRGTGIFGMMFGKRTLKNVTVCAEQYICPEQAAFIRLPTAWAPDFHTTLEEEFDNWTESSGIFSHD